MFYIFCVIIVSYLYFYRTIFIYNFNLVVFYGLEHFSMTLNISFIIVQRFSFSNLILYDLFNFILPNFNKIKLCLKSF